MSGPEELRALDKRALEAAARHIDPEMWGEDADNFLDAFAGKPHDRDRYWTFVCRHGQLGLGTRRDIARERARAAITAYLDAAESSLASPAVMEGDDPVTTVYGRLLWHHMDAMRKNDEPRRQRAFDAAQALREIWSVETQVWEDPYTPAAPRGEAE